MNEMPQSERLLRNLRDAGCDEATIQKYIQLWKEGRQKEQYWLLTKHRAALLERVHVSQQMVDCLDYLIYEMKHEQVKK